MAVRREIAQLRFETGAKTKDATLHQYVEELNGEPACRQARRSESAIAPEALMNIAG